MANNKKAGGVYFDENGNLYEDLTEEQKKQINEAAQALAAAIKTNFSITKVNDAIKLFSRIAITPEAISLLDELRSNMRQAQALLNEIEELKPFILEELQKPEYNGATIDSLLMEYEPRELQNGLPETGTLYSVMQAARARHSVFKQKAGRKSRNEIKKRAEENNAIMELKGGNYPVFSKQELWNAFAPGRLYKMGSLDEECIDEDGLIIGELKKGDIVPLEAGEISLQAFLLLNGIMMNSVDNVREKFIKDGQITFYVKGVLDAITDDPRQLLAESKTTDIDRKTAGIVYLEKLFEPLQGYIGLTNNGSRYSVFNYIGYDAEADTMTIQTPYIYQLWRNTQDDYFTRQHNKALAQAAGKKPKKADAKPLEINSLFKRKAYTENDITLEIAVYITNTLLRAGNTGKPKTTELTYKKIIASCPKLQARLRNIENQSQEPDQFQTDKKKNYTAIYNSELRKIKRAFDLILDQSKCDALQQFEFIEIRPAKQKSDGTFEIIPPTKSMINEKLSITWKRKKDD